jgi:hypothetical protein
VEKIPADRATASPAIAPTVTTVSPAPNVTAPPASVTRLTTSIASNVTTAPARATRFSTSIAAVIAALADTATTTNIAAAPPGTTDAATSPDADAVSPPRPADAGSGTAAVVCNGVSNVGPATKCNHVSLVRRGLNANQCMADENLARLKRGDHAVVDAPLRSQR